MTTSISIETLAETSNSSSDHELALSLLEGMSKNPKSLPSRFFYDDKGSELFKQIMGLEEYYPTRCEKEILQKYSGDIASKLNDGAYNIVELGCGDGMKTMILLEELLKAKKDFSFVPLDISKAAVDFLIGNLKKTYGEIPFEVKGLVAEYFEGLSWLSTNAKEKNLVLFLGSNIGNFDKSMAMRFLRHLWYSLNDGDLILIGFDLKKDLDVLYNAYNDSLGVTKEFNFNVLDRVNKNLGGNFKRENFQHQGLYNVVTGAMESYLISTVSQTVTIDELGKSFELKPWEAMHMEYSYKYQQSDIEELASGSGFEIVNGYTDDQGYFIDSLWKVKK
jgi:L-histidine N-alpha-methyltransferase